MPPPFAWLALTTASTLNALSLPAAGVPVQAWRMSALPPPNLTVGLSHGETVHGEGFQPWASEVGPPMLPFMMSRRFGLRSYQVETRPNVFTTSCGFAWYQAIGPSSF